MGSESSASISQNSGAAARNARSKQHKGRLKRSSNFNISEFAAQATSNFRSFLFEHLRESASGAPVGPL
eukprot:9531605-Alexandrium_andersonii.AAC.1